MGIFDFIFGKKTEIDDPFFGKMLFMDIKNKPEKSYFECKRYFKPGNAEIEIGIEADITGPTELQKEFFRQLETNYDRIISSVKPLIEREFRNWKEDFKIVDFRGEFKPVYLFLPRGEEKIKNWEIAFETEHDLNHTFSITMNDFKATEILIDG